MTVKTYMCIRRLEPDGETEKPMHCDSVAQVDYAALEARCRELLNEYDHGRDRARDLETDLANKQDRIAKLEESIRRYIADFKEPNTNMLSIAGLESALETGEKS